MSLCLVFSLGFEHHCALADFDYMDKNEEWVLKVKTKSNPIQLHLNKCREPCFFNSHVIQTEPASIYLFIY